MPQSKISVLIPFKNTASYLPECIDSILNQTFSMWEAIFVDDHSTDNSAKIVQDYAKHDSRIKYLKNNGSGIIDHFHHFRLNRSQDHPVFIF